MAEAEEIFWFMIENIQRYFVVQMEENIEVGPWVGKKVLKLPAIKRESLVFGMAILLKHENLSS